MGWIKSVSGQVLINTKNIVCFSVEHTGDLEDTYKICADVVTTQGYWITERMSEKDVKDTLSRIERWLESGAEGVFQV